MRISIQTGAVRSKLYLQSEGSYPDELINLDACLSGDATIIFSTFHPTIFNLPILSYCFFADVLRTK